MNKFLNALFSTRLTAILILIFAVGMGTATFIENDFGTPAARKLVFEAHWFELVIALLAINFLGNIKKYKMWKKSSWPSLLFHLSFVVVIIGAGVSRLIAFEGIMHIREGEKSNTIITDKTYLQVTGPTGELLEKELLLTSISDNSFTLNGDMGETSIEVDYVKFIPHAKEIYVAGEHGIPVLHLVATDNTSGRNDIFIQRGQVLNVFGTSISFDRPSSGEIKILSGPQDSLYIVPAHDLGFMRMADQSRDIAIADSVNRLEKRALYMHGGMNFVCQEFIPSAQLKIVSSDDKNKDRLNDALVVHARVNNQEKEVVLEGKKGVAPDFKTVNIAGHEFGLRYGSKELYTPFSIGLVDFELERYPGSMSPASYASEVKVIDGNQSFPFRIYMNHVLDYQGYRFFQASYDNDERGTVLSVNHDFLGTLITYIGYALMILGMVIAPFWPGSRFKSLVNSLRSKNTLVLLIGLGLSFASMAQSPPVVSHEHAEKFARLLVQDEGGRIKPISTTASEVLRKLQGKTTFEGQSAHQVFLGLHANPEYWSEQAIIKIAKGKNNIEAITGLSGKNARYVDFFDAEGNFLLADETDRIMKKREAERSETDKLVLEISQRVTLLYEVFNGQHMRIFPMENDPNNTWYSHTDFQAGFKGEDSIFVYHMLPYYFYEVAQACDNGKWQSADTTLGYFFIFQNQMGKAVIPAQTKVDLEVWYNKYEIFNRLYKYYGLVGFLFLCLLITSLLSEQRWINRVVPLFTGLIILLFAAHTFGLGVRWYISGHAPWSNAYESMVYVAWSTVLAGILFVRRSKITLAATAIMASTFLMVAHWNWMNPEIGNLVPVLNSYWLMIHVAIIVASYGPFTLNLILGVIGLTLVIFKTRSNAKKLEQQIDRLTKINELIMTVGVFLLAVGTFLGGVWANESWGRYWSWDPKETWALISVMVYAFVLHMRLIPGLKGKVAFNIASTFAYASIMMTYFGVNYYLAGMHSYAKGDPVPIPDFVYYAVASLLVLSFAAYYRNRKFGTKVNREKE